MQALILRKLTFLLLLPLYFKGDSVHIVVLSIFDSSSCRYREHGVGLTHHSRFWIKISGLLTTQITISQFI